MNTSDRKMNLMVVDDSFLMRNIIKSIVQKDPSLNVVAEAGNGQEALELLEQHPELDVVLLDIEMPVMDGLQFLKAARLKTIAKFIIISSIAKLDSPEAKEALELGAHEVINKPSGVLSVDMEETKSKEILDSLHRALDG